MVAETTTGCFISADTAISHTRHEETSSLEDDVKKGLMPPVDVGEGIAKVLLGEIAQGGVVDSTHQVSMSAISTCFYLSYQMIRYWY